MTAHMDASPPTLYKYFGPDRVDVLASGLIRYTPLGAFNDPFEGQPEVTSLNTEAGTRDLLNAVLPQAAREAYNELPAEARAALPYEFFEQLLVQKMKSNETGFFQSIHGLTPFVQSLMTRKFDELLGALCLSEVPDSLLMWSHYGASHSGFVLAFDACHPHFHEKKGPNDEFRHLRRVVYCEARPSATLVEFDGVDIFLVKSSHWSYEREWRIFRALSEADVVCPGELFNTHLFRFPPTALQAVIVGARSSTKTTEAIFAAIRANNALGHVRVKRARLDSSHFLLHITDEDI
jgi:hypothetical protein